MEVFRPTYLGCPVCNTDPQRHFGSSIGAFQRLEDGGYRSVECGHDFTLFDALHKGCRGMFGVVGTFAHWSWTSNEELVVGRLSTIQVPVPSGFKSFAVFLTPEWPPNDQEYASNFRPDIVHMGESNLLISLVGLGNVPVEALGKRGKVCAAVYAYRANDFRGWMRLLYDGLTDFSSQQYALALFKLATSMEIGCDQVVRRYLERQGLRASMIDRLLRNSRSWSERFSRFREVSSEFLSERESEVLSKSSEVIDRTLRSHRNAFAHDDPVLPNHRQASEAFHASFPLIWAVDKVLCQLDGR